MLSVSLLERTLEVRDYDRLLRELADNGLVLPLSLRVSLGQSQVAPLALALRRLLELTYSPTRLSRRLVDDLLSAQNHDGTFGQNGHDPLETAAAVAGLARVACEQPGVRVDEITQVLGRGYAALAELQDCDGLFSASTDRSLADRALTTAFMVHLLGDTPTFRAAVRLHEIYAWFDRHEHRLDRHTLQLWDLAQLAIHDVIENMTMAA